MPCFRTGLIFAFIVTLASPRSLLSQEQQVIELGVHPGEQSQTGKGPSNFSLIARSTGKSVLGAVVGGLLGLTVDDAYCERHHGDEPAVLFGPCFLYANEGFGAGWFGGGIIGSTYGAVKTARKRGCASNAALLRAITGAAVSVAPGVIIAAKRTGKYSPSRSAFIASAPLLAGIGAAAAVVGCRGR
jgi:hypothetical protein